MINPYAPPDEPNPTPAVRPISTGRAHSSWHPLQRSLRLYQRGLVVLLSTFIAWIVSMIGGGVIRMYAAQPSWMDIYRGVLMVVSAMTLVGLAAGWGLMTASVWRTVDPTRTGVMRRTWPTVAAVLYVTLPIIATARVLAFSWPQPPTITVAAMLIIAAAATTCHSLAMGSIGETIGRPDFTNSLTRIQVCLSLCFAAFVVFIMLAGSGTRGSITAGLGLMVFATIIATGITVLMHIAMPERLAAMMDGAPRCRSDATEIDDPLGDDRVGDDQLGDDQLGDDQLGDDQLGDDRTRPR